MERITALPRGMQFMLVGGVLLLIDTFLKWQDYSASVGTVSVSASRNAWHGWGLLAGLLTIVLLVWLGARLAATDLRLPISDTMAGAALAALILLFTIIKVLTDNYRAMWAWIGLVLAALIAVGAWLQVTAGGGVDTLRTEASGMRARAGDTGAATSTPTPPPPPVDETPPQGGDRT